MDTHRHRQTDRQTDRHTHTHTHIHTHTLKERNKARCVKCTTVITRPNNQQKLVSDMVCVCNVIV